MKFILPFIVLLSFITSYLISGRLFGYNIAGWIWVLILAAALLQIAKSFANIKYPIAYWAPWGLLVLAYGFSGFANAYQSSAQILCPIAVGFAASTVPLSEKDLDALFRYMRIFFFGFLLFFCFRILPWTLADIERSGFPAGAISALFFQSVFLCSYLLRGRKTLDLCLYLSALAVPVISSNRGPILGSLGLLLLVVAPLPLRSRIILGAAAIAIGLFAFNSPKVQHKMFYSGQGAISDLRLDNPNLNTSGRKVMWDTLKRGIEDKPWWGHGGNADAAYLIDRGFILYLPHNDWLRIRFNYGHVGMALYLGTMLVQIFLAYRASLRSPPFRRLFFCIGASCFMPYMIVMYTDNILIYCQYFTVLHFMILGLAYAAQGNRATAIAGAGQPIRGKIIIRRKEQLTVNT